MATINISINDSASQHELTTSQPKSVTAEELAPASGGSAPGNEGSEATGSSVANQADAVSANGLVDIGAPPAWLHDAVAAHEASAGQEGSGTDNNTSGGAAPTE
jgi:hypothetical protein